MAKYRKKPVIVEIVEAEQWNPKGREGWPGIGKPDRLGVVWEFDTKGEVCRGYTDTDEGCRTVLIGDWVIKGVNGEYCPCKPDIFEQTYEKVED